MRVCFYASDKPREQLLADALIQGLGPQDLGMKRRVGEPMLMDYDVACFVGVKSREIHRAHAQAGVHTLYFDKGYTREKSSSPVRGSWKYWRVAVDGHQPTRYLMDIERPHDRLRGLRLKIKDSAPGDRVLFCGSSEKYHAFYDLPHPTTYAKTVCRKIVKVTAGQVIYRPKPSWKNAEQITRAELSQGIRSIGEDLARSWAMVTHGSNACFEAMLAGVPCIVLGDAVARPICQTSIGDLAAVKLPSVDVRRQWAANLAYCQWTLQELATGQAWPIIRDQIYAS